MARNEPLGATAVASPSDRAVLTESDAVKMTPVHLSGAEPDGGV
jgi:hypothetical protein